MEINLLRLISVALLVHLAAGLDTKMFQLTMPNVRPYRVSLDCCLLREMLIHMLGECQGDVENGSLGNYPLQRNS